jgi:hypothetical protein
VTWLPSALTYSSPNREMGLSDVFGVALLLFRGRGFENGISSGL